MTDTAVVGKFLGKEDHNMKTFKLDLMTALALLVFFGLISTMIIQGAV